MPCGPNRLKPRQLPFSSSAPSSRPFCFWRPKSGTSSTLTLTLFRPVLVAFLPPEAPGVAGRIERLGPFRAVRPGHATLLSCTPVRARVAGAGGGEAGPGIALWLLRFCPRGRVQAPARLLSARERRIGACHAKPGWGSRELRLSLSRSSAHAAAVSVLSLPFTCLFS